VEEIVPDEADHETPGFEEFVTVAVNCDVPDGCRADVVGVTDTATAAETAI
jgi:hypothetical protein